MYHTDTTYKAWFMRGNVCLSADFSDAVLIKISKHIGHEWRSLAALLGLERPQVDQIERKHIKEPKQVNFCILQVRLNQLC